MNLEFKAMAWLRWKKRCPVALFERSPRLHCGEPDVLGITRARYLIEIEIKRSVSDFRANSAKPHVANRELFLERWPKQFYYLAPQKLAERIRPEVPAWAGLMTETEGGVYVLHPAPSNYESKPLTANECARLIHALANQAYSSEQKAWNFRQAFQAGHEPWWPIEYQI